MSSRVDLRAAQVWALGALIEDANLRLGPGPNAYHRAAVLFANHLNIDMFMTYPNRVTADWRHTEAGRVAA